jgi:hypothetical protein
MTTRDSLSGSYGSGSSSPGGGSYTEPLPVSGSMSGATGGDAVQQAKDKAGEVVDQAQQKTGEVVDQAKQQAASQLSVQKDRAAEGLGSVADALRQTSQQLQQQQAAGPIGDYAARAADQIDRFSTYLQHRDVNQIVGEVERFARREPVLFLGGAFALGALAARFLKSSSDQARMQEYGGQGGQYGQYYGRSATSGYSGSYSGGAGYGAGSSYSAGSGYGAGSGSGAGGYGATRGYDTGAGSAYSGRGAGYGGAGYGSGASGVAGGGTVIEPARLYDTTPADQPLSYGLESDGGTGGSTGTGGT